MIFLKVKYTIFLLEFENFRFKIFYKTYIDILSSKVFVWRVAFLSPCMFLLSQGK